MKTLNKLKLKEFHKMTDLEMRNVVGGYENGGSLPTCKYTCPGSTEKTITCSKGATCENLTGGSIGVECVLNGKSEGSKIMCVNSPS